MFLPLSLLLRRLSVAVLVTVLVTSGAAAQSSEGVLGPPPTAVAFDLPSGYAGPPPPVAPATMSRDEQGRVTIR